MAERFTVIDGIAYPVAEQAAPVAVKAAEAVTYISPLERLGIAGGSASTPADLPSDLLIAWQNAPQGHAQREVRETARILRVPRFACSVDVKAQTTTGETITMSAHGYWRPAKTGEPCKGNGCAGTVL